MSEPYVTLEEAEELVTQNFMSQSLARKYWDALTEEDKMVVLRGAFRAIEQLPFAGRQSDPEQVGAFPRWPHTEVPPEVKLAQVFIAVDFADPTVEQERERYRRMRVAGVSSYRVGKFSESLKSADSSGYGAGLGNQEALNLLRPWLGSYRIV